MNDNDLPRSEREDPMSEFRHLLLGLASASALTATAFALVPFSTRWMPVALGGLALVRIAAQSRYFLHVDLKKSHRDDLQLVLFAGLVIAMMASGSIWILFNQHACTGQAAPTALPRAGQSGMAARTLSGVIGNSNRRAPQAL